MRQKENIIKLKSFYCNLYRAHIQKGLLVELCYEHSTLDIEPLHVKLYADRALINCIGRSIRAQKALCSKHLNSGQTSPAVKWSGFRMVWKPDSKLCFMVFNVWYSNGPPNHVISLLENGTKSVWKVNCSDFRCLVFR